jgi:hypothetical protein
MTGVSVSILPDIHLASRKRVEVKRAWSIALSSQSAWSAITPMNCAARKPAKAKPSTIGSNAAPFRSDDNKLIAPLARIDDAKCFYGHDVSIEPKQEINPF